MGSADAHQVKLGDLAVQKGLPMEATEVSISLGLRGKAKDVIIITPGRLLYCSNLKDVKANRAHLPQEFISVLFLLSQVYLGLDDSLVWE